MSLKVRMDYQYHDLKLERSQSPGLGFAPEFLPNLSSQIRPILYVKGSFDLVSTVVRQGGNRSFDKLQFLTSVLRWLLLRPDRKDL